MSFPQYKYFENYDARETDRYIGFLAQLGSAICFDDDTWACDKRVRSASDQKSFTHIYFSSIPNAYKKPMKYYAIICLLRGDGIRSVRTHVKAITLFCKFLSNDCLTPPISEWDIRTATQFKTHLDNSALAEDSKRSSWVSVSSFLNVMNGFEGIQYKNSFSVNPYPRPTALDYKYIPDSVVNVLDGVFSKEDIDLHIRCIYWILRLIPSRISEVLSIKIDCVKPYRDHFIVFIPTWKQNGGNMEPILRSIHIQDTGIAGYLLKLLEEQRRAATDLQKHLPNHKRGMLFAYRQVHHYGDGTTSKPGKLVGLAQQSFVAYHFDRICKQYGVRDEDGSIYHLTSHQFRHNGITDRLEAGFTLEQIADMTGHHGNAMIWQSYAHLNLKPQTIIQRQQYVLDEPAQLENKYIFFGGRILNMEEQLENRLLRNLRAHRVPGGICSDVTACKSDMWSCLDCEDFIPDSEQLPYFEGQAAAWYDKADQFRNSPIIHSNSLKNAALFGHIIARIKDVLVNE